jgi:hypothetical protein
MSFHLRENVLNRIEFSGTLRRVALVIPDVSEEHIASEISVLTRATRVTSQKTTFFIVTALKTSNVT